MSYSSEKGVFGLESNSTSLAMFASVGFHAVFFVLMAFFPAASETAQKPLRIVNLLPPNPSSDPSITAPQAKTSTLEDILKNPLPDLSAGFPPLGNNVAPTNEPDPDSSTYLGGNTALNNRVDVSGLSTRDIPNQSFQSNPATNSSPSRPSSLSGSIPTPNNLPSLPTPPSSSIAPAPPSTNNGGVGAGVPPRLNSSAPVPSGSINPSPFPPVGTPPDVLGAANPGAVNSLPGGTGNGVPESKQNIVPVITASIPFSYPEAACQDKLEGTASLSYYRDPDGSYVAGSGSFDNSSGSRILDDVALNAITNWSAAGTGNYQRYFSRFDFVHSDQACVAAAPSSPKTAPSSSSPAQNSAKPGKPLEQDSILPNPAKSPAATPAPQSTGEPSPLNKTPKTQSPTSGDVKQPSTEATGESAENSTQPTLERPTPAEPINIQKAEPKTSPDPEANQPVPAKKLEASPELGTARDLQPINEPKSEQPAVQSPES